MLKLRLAALGTVAALAALTPNPPLPAILAQTPPAAKLFAFDVVSMHPSPPGANVIYTATTPDGYSVPNQPLIYTILMAYFPQGTAYWSGDRLSGAPPWINDPYDIDAKVSEADLPEWQRQSQLPLGQQVMFQQMLQSMLADRCHLVAHMVPGPPISGFSLELGKHGPHLTEFKSGETVPAKGTKLPSGGVMVPSQRGDKPQLTFYGATMAELAERLYTQGHPVQDHTGLTGRYDFVLNGADDPEGLSRWDLDSLGLRVTPTKLPMDTLVIDHIEKPSEN